MNSGQYPSKLTFAKTSPPAHNGSRDDGEVIYFRAYWKIEEIKRTSATGLTVTARRSEPRIEPLPAYRWLPETSVGKKLQPYTCNSLG